MVIETVVTLLASAVNVAVSFMTDGQWKTAGMSISQFYWNSVAIQRTRR